MNVNLILRLVAIIFVSVTSLLLILMVFNVVDSAETQDGIVKLAAVSAIIAATSMVISLLGKNKS